MVFVAVIVFLGRWRVCAFVVHVVVAEERPVGRLGSVRGAGGVLWCGVKTPRPFDVDAPRLVMLTSYARWRSREVVVVLLVEAVLDASAQPGGSSPLFVFSADPAAAAAGRGAPTALSSLLVLVVAIVPGLQQEVKVQSSAHSIIH